MGDTFQSLGAPTLLFEAGHSKGDYARDRTAKRVLDALLLAIEALHSGAWTEYIDRYDQIPKNDERYFDVIIRNALIGEDSQNELAKDVGIRYREELRDNKIVFVPCVEALEDLGAYFGHLEIDAQFQRVKTASNTDISIGYENDIVLINNEVLSVNTTIS